MQKPKRTDKLKIYRIHVNTLNTPRFVFIVDMMVNDRAACVANTCPVCVSDGYFNVSWSHRGDFSCEAQTGGRGAWNGEWEGVDEQQCQVTLWLPHRGRKVRETGHFCLTDRIYIIFYLISLLSYPLQVSELQVPDSQPQTKLSLRAWGSAESSG